MNTEIRLDEIEQAGPDQAALQSLNEEIEACRLCAEQGYIAIPRPIDRGKGLGRVWLVGQAPGYGEGVRKMAFGGPAGRTLMRWFEAIDLPEEAVRTQFYLSAITKCYPGRAPKGGGDRNPSPGERANCRPYLLRELVLLRPRFIILVGGTAIKEFYGDKIRLDQIIGQERNFELGELYGRLAERLVKSGKAPAIPPPPPGFNSKATATLFHLPHPSGASTWLNFPENRALLEQSLAKLKASFFENRLFPD